MALMNSKTGCLPVSEIYSFMTEHFPYFKVSPLIEFLFDYLATHLWIIRVVLSYVFIPKSPRFGSLWRKITCILLFFDSILKL